LAWNVLNVTFYPHTYTPCKIICEFISEHYYILWCSWHTFFLAYIVRDDDPSGKHGKSIYLMRPEMYSLYANVPNNMLAYNELGKGKRYKYLSLHILHYRVNNHRVRSHPHSPLSIYACISSHVIYVYISSNAHYVSLSLPMPSLCLSYVFAAQLYCNFNGYPETTRCDSDQIEHSGDFSFLLTSAPFDTDVKGPAFDYSGDADGKFLLVDLSWGQTESQVARCVPSPSRVEC
jgi:hypothetical protein